MKKRIAVILLIVPVLIAMLTGCSVLEEVNRSVDYVNETTTYINDAGAFAERLRGLAEQAVNDPAVKETIVQELETMKEKILNFNALEAPQLARDLHDQIVSYNETLLVEINGFLGQFNDQIDAVESILNSPIFETINNITQLLQQLENLGL